MTPKRTLPATYIMKWVTFMVVVVFGLWFLRAMQARSDAGGVEVRAEPAKEVVAAPVVAEKPPEPKARAEKKAEVAETPREVVSGRPERNASPMIEDQDYRPAAEVLDSTRRTEPKLGAEEEAPAAAKGWVEAEDKTYVGKVVPCEGEKYDRGTVMGSGGPLGLNYFYMCLDIGSAFTKVKADNLMNPLMYSYKGNDYHRAVGLRKNDVVRVKVNDGQVLKLEMVKSVLD